MGREEGVGEGEACCCAAGIREANCCHEANSKARHGNAIAGGGGRRGRGRGGGEGGVLGPLG